MSGSDSLYLTDVSLCDGPMPSLSRMSSAISAASPRLWRVELPPSLAQDPALAALHAAGPPLMVRCSASQDAARLARGIGAMGVTLWVESAISLARRQQGESRPAEAVRLKRAVQSARKAGLEVVIAFPFEMERMRTLLNFGFLAQSFGVDRMRLVERSGAAHPLDIFRCIRTLRERLSTPIEIDVSNCCGLAMGVAVCAVRAGVRHLAVTSLAPETGSQHVPLDSLQGCAAAGSLSA